MRDLTLFWLILLLIVAHRCLSSLLLIASVQNYIIDVLSAFLLLAVLLSVIRFEGLAIVPIQLRVVALARSVQLSLVVDAGRSLSELLGLLTWRIIQSVLAPIPCGFRLALGAIIRIESCVGCLLIP